MPFRVYGVLAASRVREAVGRGGEQGRALSPGERRPARRLVIFDEEPDLFGARRRGHVEALRVRKWVAAWPTKVVSLSTLRLSQS